LSCTIAHGFKIFTSLEHENASQSKRLANTGFEALWLKMIGRTVSRRIKPASEPVKIPDGPEKGDHLENSACVTGLNATVSRAENRGTNHHELSRSVNA